MVILGVVLLLIYLLVTSLPILLILGIVFVVLGLLAGYGPRGPWAGTGTTRRRFY